MLTMEVAIEHFLDAEEQDANGDWDYFYEGDLFTFSADPSSDREIPQGADLQRYAEARVVRRAPGETGDVAIDRPSGRVPPQPRGDRDPLPWARRLRDLVV